MWSQYAVPDHRPSPLHKIAGASLRWALPRLALYAAAAIAGAVLFAGWAVFYTYVWPGPSQKAPPPLDLLPHSAPKTSPVTEPQPIAPDQDALVALLNSKIEKTSVDAPIFEARLVGTPVFGPKSQHLGKVTGVLFGSNGAPKAVTIGLQCSSCDAKSIALPFRDVKWVSSSPAGDNASNVTPSIRFGIVSHSAAELEKAPGFQNQR